MEYIIQFKKLGASFADGAEAIADRMANVTEENRAKFRSLNTEFGIVNQPSWDPEMHILTVTKVFPEGTTSAQVEDYVYKSMEFTLTNAEMNGWVAIAI
jgi:hypothetical protein